jgi:hypothetical protein
MCTSFYALRSLLPRNHSTGVILILLYRSLKLCIRTRKRTFTNTYNSFRCKLVHTFPNSAVVLRVTQHTK